MHQLIGKKKYLILYFLFLIALSTTTNKTLNKTENLFQIENINITGLPLEKINELHNKLYNSIENCLPIPPLAPVIKAHGPELFFLSVSLNSAYLSIIFCSEINAY